MKLNIQPQPKEGSSSSVVMHVANTLSVKNVQAVGNRIVIDHDLDGHTVQTVVTYKDMDISVIEKKYGADFLQTILAHIALYEGLKFCSYAPKHYDVSSISAYLKQQALDVFDQLYSNIFTQHRFENDLANYEGPMFVTENLGSKKISIERTGKHKLLVGCGGGKDSLVVMKLLERAGYSFGIYQYSHTIYGEEDDQHDLIDSLIGHIAIDCQHQVSVEDPFFDSKEMRETYPAIKTLYHPETPNSIFQSLVIMLVHGYSSLCLGHEKSADEGNFYWKEEEREVNHQWGKSYEAERLLHSYISESIITGFQYFSPLKPIHDFLIFHLLKKDQHLMKLTSSCNIRKPWCMECAKCVYVWLNSVAYLEKEHLPEDFSQNLFEEESLLDMFSHMLGVTGHKPFECIGEIGETRLAFYHCYKKGMTGKAMDLFVKEVLPTEDFQQLKEKYGTVDEEKHLIPDFLSKSLFEEFRSISY